MIQINVYKYALLILKGLVTNITIFNRTRDPELTKKSLEVSYTQQNESYNSVALKGTDLQLIVLRGFVWKKRLEYCQLSNEVTVKENLWESTWADEIEFRDMFLPKFCNASDPKDYMSQKQIILSNSSFTLRINVRNLDANESITANRYYVSDKFYYKVMLNITGVYDNVDNIYGPVEAEELEDSLVQSGLTFVRKLDNFTVLAEETALIKSDFRVSTLYKIGVTAEF